MYFGTSSHFAFIIEPQTLWYLFEWVRETGYVDNNQVFVMNRILEN